MNLELELGTWTQNMNSKHELRTELRTRNMNSEHELGTLTQNMKSERKLKTWT